MTIYTTTQTLRQMLSIADAENDRVGTPITVQKIDGSDVDWSTEPQIITVSSGHKVRIWEDVDHAVEIDDNGDTSINPTPDGTAGDTLVLDGIDITTTDGSLESATGTLTLTLGGGAVVPGDPPAAVSMTPAASSTDVPVASSLTITADQFLSAGTGSITIRNVTDSTDIETLAVPGDLGTGNGTVTLGTDYFTVDPTSDLPDGKQVGLRWTAGVFENASGDALPAETGDTWSVTTAAAVPGSTLPAPTRQTFWFDHTTATYDTTTNAATWGAIETAIQTALADPGTVGSPKYHDIVYTGGNISGNQTLGFAGSLPAYGTVFIRVRPTTSKTRVTSSITVNSGPGYVLWTDWRFDASKTTNAPAAAKAIIFNFQNGASADYFAFDDCDVGTYWRSITDPAEFPEFLGGSGIANASMRIKNCMMWNIFQVVDAWSGYFHLENNFITGLVDDTLAMTVRNQTPHTCYGYLARNVIALATDSAAQSGYHPDQGVQTGTPADSSLDNFEVEAYENIIIGDKYQQYPTHGFFMQIGGGSANAWTAKIHNNVVLCTGWRAIELSSKDADVQGFLAAWPPLAGPIPTTGTGWNGGPSRPQIWLNANKPSGASLTPTLENIICDQVADKVGWGVTPTGVYHRAIPTAAHGASNANAYDEVFQSLAGMSYSGGQTRIDPTSSGYLAAVASAMSARDPQEIRDWVSTSYEPTTSAGTGWVVNGITDPAGWHE